MQQPHPFPASSDPLPASFLARLAGFAHLFTRPTWLQVPLLLAGAILAPGRRTVTAALRILGRDHDPHFCTLHRILNRAVWSPRAAAGHVLTLLIKAFVPAGAPVVIGFDDTIERRWGPKISARGIYRDPVRSSKGHFVKASGLRWLSAMLLVQVPWADRVMALPFLTLLAPSKRFYTNKKRAPKTLLDWARQAALQIHRWLPDRYVVLVADSAFAAIEFLAAVCNCVCVVTRLRLDANLFDFPPAKHKGRGRKPIKGKPQKKLSAVLKDRKVSWKRYRVSLWYGRTNRLVEIASGTWQFGPNIVFGVEWFFDGLANSNDQSVTFISRATGDSIAASVKADWITTITGRIGFTIPTDNQSFFMTFHDLPTLRVVPPFCRGSKYPAHRTSEAC